MSSNDSENLGNINAGQVRDIRILREIIDGRCLMKLRATSRNVARNSLTHYAFSFVVVVAFVIASFFFVLRLRAFVMRSR